MNEELRRITRVAVCCRVVVRDRYGLWSGVTEDLSARGCQISTGRLLRTGTIVELTLESDLFPEALEVTGKVVWANRARLGVAFTGCNGDGPSPDAWLRSVIEQGQMPDSASSWRVVPSVVPAAARTVLRPIRSASAGQGKPSAD